MKQWSKCLVTKNNDPPFSCQANDLLKLPSRDDGPAWILGHVENDHFGIVFE